MNKMSGPSGGGIFFDSHWIPRTYPTWWHWNSENITQCANVNGTTCQKDLKERPRECPHTM